MSERRLAQEHLAEDASEADQDSAEASVFEGFKMAIEDPYVPVFMLVLLTVATRLTYLKKSQQSEYSPGFTLTLVWVANAIPRPPAKRSVAMDLVNGFGNLGIV
ncbi:hypothetical protein CY34DRAFT_11384 [Suillus luteus UH-Slu-Lm8-n1]|uniref:Uncharacterized protein n=1 Tax=Suillus luteus UH-Slu-Lm8-n1 TaxID=930992 RepID=A0A0D0A262_9AGAM|nr:hypothetical protein CY34DRAFT_11384 [Suillus luteus UH-Slu-Lm8-n1]